MRTRATPWLLLLVLLLPCSPPPARAADGDVTSATQPSLTDVRRDRQRVLDLSRRAITQIKARKLDEADATLREALALAPGLAVNLYNMACVQALRGNSDEALYFLERAALAGYTDFGYLERDPDMASLRGLRRYRELVARKDVYQRRAAERVVAWLKRELGEGYRFEIDQPNKLIFATKTDAQTLTALRNKLLMQARSQWDLLFEHRPDQYISVVLMSPEDAKGLLASPGIAGLYNHDLRILVARRMGQVMVHEFTHALHAADLDPLGQEHAVWFAEGLGAMFEASEVQGEKLVPADNFRLPYLQAAARRGRLIPLQRLLRMDQKAFIQNPTAAYGQSSSLLLYLYDRGLLRAFYDEYKKSFDRDKTGRIALEKVTGRRLSDLEGDWRDWMMSRSAPVMSTGPDGVYLGVRFGDANDGLRVVSVMPNTPAARAGLRAGDVIVALEDADVRDQQTFMPLLARYEPGDRVMLHVRRGDEYLDVPIVLARRSEQ